MGMIVRIRTMSTMGFKNSASKSNSWSVSFACIIFQMMLIYNGHLTHAAEMYPFGEDVGSQNLELGDEETTEVHISSIVKVAGNMYDSLFVAANGFISFGITEAYPDKFIPGYVQLVGLGSDVDRPKGGQIWVQETVDPQLLSPLESEVHLVDMQFDAIWAGIATWSEVAGYEIPLNLRNSFQIIVVADTMRGKTFGILNYERVQWTVTDYHDYSAGFFSGGHDLHFELGEGLPFDEFEDLLLTASNVGIPGKFILRIDGDEFCIVSLPPQMSVDSDLQISNMVNVTYVVGDRKVVKCQNHPDEWNDSRREVELRCENQTGIFDSETNITTLTVDLGKDWDGAICRCEMSSLECTSSIAFVMISTVPTITRFSIKNQTELVESEPGVSLKFECVVGGLPAPLVTVKRVQSGEVIANQTAEGNTVSVDKVITCSDMDQYVCDAENVMGSSSQSSIVLHTLCIELMEEVNDIRVVDDSVVDVTFHVLAISKPDTFVLKIRQRGQKQYTDELHIDPTHYFVNYRANDLMGQGTVRLKFIDFDLVDQNVYEFKMSNRLGQTLEVSFTTTRGGPVVDKERGMAMPNLIIVGIIGCIVVLIIGVFPAAYWYYATEKGVKSPSMVDKEKRKNPRQPMQVYALQGPPTDNRLWRQNRF